MRHRIFHAVTTAAFLLGFINANAGNAAPVEATTATPTVLATPTFSTPQISCTIMVDPAAPMVGDVVHIEVQRSSSGLGYSSYSLDAGTFFSGSTGTQSTSTFDLEAIRAGTVTLIALTTDEFIIGYVGDRPIHEFAAASCRVDIVVGGGPSPTPTPTDHTPAATPLFTPSPTPSFECHLIRGSVTISGPDIVSPLLIEVGAAIELRFDMSYLAYQINSIRLDGTSELFAVETLPSSGTTFRLTAIAPGTAMVRLIVIYGTEELCGDGRGGTYYRVGPNNTETSQAFEIVVTLPATATPTPTSSPTVTATPTVASDSSDGSGCVIDRNARGSIVLLAPLLITLRARRQRHAKHRTTPRRS